MFSLIKPNKVAIDFVSLVMADSPDLRFLEIRVS